MIGSRRQMLAILPLVAAGCVRDRGAPDGESVRIVTGDDARTIDPLDAYDTWSTAIVEACTRRLINYDMEARLRPDAALSWSSTSDGMEWSFRLRPGMRFSDGSTVEAHHFAGRLNALRLPDSPSPGASFYSAIASASAIRPDLLELKLSRPDPTLLNALALTFASPALEGKGLRDGGASGPYRIEEYEPGVRARLAANASGDRPPLDILFRIDEPLQLARMESGGVDLLPSVPPALYGQVMRDPARRRLLVQQSVSQTWYFGMNSSAAPWNDPRVRKAAYLAIDRGRCARMSAGGVEANGMLPPHVPGYNASRKLAPRDITRAQQLVGEAAPSGGLPLRGGDFWLPNNGLAQRIGQSIQADLREAGLAVDLKSVTLSEYLTGYRTHAACWYGGWYPDFPDGGNFLEPVLHSRNIKPGRSPNAARFANDEFDSLLDAAAGLSGVERARLHSAAEEVALREIPWAPLYFETEARLHSQRLRGVVVHPVWRQMLTGLKLAPARAQKGDGP